MVLCRPETRRLRYGRRVSTVGWRRHEAAVFGIIPSSVESLPFVFYSQYLFSQFMGCIAHEYMWETGTYAVLCR
jgi:hypothetical protein